MRRAGTPPLHGPGTGPSDPRAEATLALGDAAGEEGTAEDGPRFVLHGELGRGGMGVVEAWEDRVLRRRVALKRLREDAVGAAARRRFLREASLTAGLEHPGIVPVHDVGVGADGVPWYSMRLVEGRTLAEVLSATDARAERLTLVRVVHAVAHAVAYAHAHGVVHRDLKPDNVVVGRFGEVTVLDWGVARRVSASDDHAPEVGGEGSSGTLVGSVVGTLGYMSPEAARGEPASFAMDVWSLGAILFRVLAGEPPQARYPADEALGVARRGAVGALPAWVPPPLASVVRRALAPATGDRHPDASAFVEDLSAWIDGRRVPSHRYRLGEALALWGRRHRDTLRWVGPVLGALLLVAGVAAWRGAAERARAEEAAHAANLERVRGEAARAAADTERARYHLEQGELAEAGRAAARALGLGEDPDRRGLLLAAEATRGLELQAEVSLPEACDEVEALPDGGWACASGGHLAVYDDRGAPRWRSEVPVRALHVGRGVLLVDEAYVWVGRDPLTGERVEGPGVLSEGGGPRWSSGHHPGAHVFAQALAIHRRGPGDERASREACPRATEVRALAASPDGRTVAWLCDPWGPVRVAPLGGSGPTWEAAPELPTDAPPYAGLAWGPGQAGLAVARGDGVIVVVDPVGRRPLRELVSAEGSGARIQWTGDGRHLVVERDVGGARVVSARDGRSPGRLPVDAGRVVAVGPGLVGAARTVGDLTRVRTFAVDAAATRVLRHPDGVASLCVAPEGGVLAAALGNAEVWRWDPDGSDEPLRLRWQGGVAKGCAFSPDGRVLAAWGVGEPGARWFDAADGAPGGQIVTALPLRRGAFVGADVFLPIAFGVPSGTPVTLDGRPAGPTLDRGGLVLDVSATSDGTTVAFVDERGRVALLRDQGASIDELGTLDGAGRVALSEDGAWVAVLTDGALFVAATSPGAGWQPVEGAPSDLTAVGLSADGRWLAAGGLDGRVHLWRRDDRALVAVARAHEARVSAVVFPPTGGTAWSGGWDGRVLRWDLAGLERDAAAWQDRLDGTWGAVSSPAP